MKIDIDINGTYNETSVTIHTKEWTDELDMLVKVINHSGVKRLIGVDGEESILLHPKEIDYIYAESRKVFAVRGKTITQLKMKLYEVESFLLPHYFTRFSKSVIGNIEQIQKFELSFNSNLCVTFRSGNKEYVSRKYVSALKEKLMIGGESNDT